MLCFRKGINMYYILMCRSMTAAQKTARALQRAGVFAAVTKAPQSANPNGCTYGVKIAERNISGTTAILSREKLQVEKILELDGRNLREVRF